MSSENASPARTETSLNISEIARDSSRSTRGAGLGEALGTAAAPLVNGCNVTLPVGMTKERRAAESAFTIIELLVVIAIIIVLAGLILSTVGYVQKKEPVPGPKPRSPPSPPRWKATEPITGFTREIVTRTASLLSRIPHTRAKVRPIRNQRAMTPLRAATRTRVLACTS